MKKAVTLLLSLALLGSTIQLGYADIVDSEVAVFEGISSHGAALDEKFRIDYSGVPLDFSKFTDDRIDSAFLAKDIYKGRHLNAWSLHMSSYGENELTLEFKADYWMDSKKAYETDLVIDEVLKAIIKPEMNATLKETQIARFILSNTHYDNKLEKYSAFDALLEKEAVCQGYATLFYRMASKAGLPVQMIEGKLEGNGHMWNMVKLGGVWYHVDLTNEDENPGLFYNQSDERLQQYGFVWDKTKYPAVKQAYAINRLEPVTSSVATEVLAKIDLKSIANKVERWDLERNIVEIGKAFPMGSESIKELKSRIAVLKDAEIRETLYLKLLTAENRSRENRRLYMAYEQSLEAFESTWSKENFKKLEVAIDDIAKNAPDILTAKMLAEKNEYGRQMN